MIGEVCTLASNMCDFYAFFIAGRVITFLYHLKWLKAVVYYQYIISLCFCLFVSEKVVC